MYPSEPTAARTLPTPKVCPSVVVLAVRVMAVSISWGMAYRHETGRVSSRAARVDSDTADRPYPSACGRS